jgi:hypothetical protein
MIPGDQEYFNAKLSAPNEFWNANVSTRYKICGGCGAGKLGDMLIPDTLWGLNVTFCCKIHDWRYHYGSTIEDKNSADREFLNNLLRWIDHKTDSKVLRYFRHARALKYYEAVQMFGGPAFWNGKGDGK